jgi:rubrerythrin
VEKNKGDDMEKLKAIEGLMTALQTELNGIEFYRMAAEKTDDPKGKKVFEMLATDEYMHFETLQKQYTSLVKKNEWQNIDIGEASALEGESPIFSAELKERLKGKHFEMTALSIGAMLESNSIDFYRKMKEESGDPAAVKLYSQLVKWEQGHLEAITKQLDLMKEEYWAEQRFTPLF